jgi:hypothetical protein
MVYGWFAVSVKGVISPPIVFTWALVEVQLCRKDLSGASKSCDPDSAVELTANVVIAKSWGERG